MITILKPEKQFKPKIGAFIYGDETLLGKYDKKVLDMNILPLNFGNVTTNAMESIGIEGAEDFVKQFEYKCPFNKYIHQAVAPIFIVSNSPVTKYFDGEKYKPWYTINCGGCDETKIVNVKKQVIRDLRKKVKECTMAIEGGTEINDIRGKVYRQDFWI